MKKIMVVGATLVLFALIANVALAQSGNLKLKKHLRLGMSDADIALLQEILATDPDVYPEALVTGYFGPLTEKAVRKFQAKNGIETVGNVGPKTFARINELLTLGAGNSGKVPPGLLIAPGIAKKLATTTVREPLPGQKLPPGIAKKLAKNNTATTTDTGAPVISKLSATSTASTTLTVSWKTKSWKTNEGANGKLWWGTTTPLTVDSSSMSNGTYKKKHSFTISNLTASTTVYYVAVSADKYGNTATSTEQSGVTLGE